MSRPLISILFVTYKQENFVREALESVLNQNYSPLEIIISDDNSRDNTFKIVEEMVKAYQGPHTLKLNRNAKNLGIGGNVNRAMELSAGELVVVAAGDDISLPNRTEVLYEAWEQSGRRATSIFSSYMAISHDGTEQGIGGERGKTHDASVFRPLAGDLFTFLSTRVPVVSGCTHAWSRSLYDFFGPLTSDLEDSVLSFRSLAIGQMLYVHQPLVKYRRHEGNVSFFGKKETRISFESREKRLRWVDEKSAAAFNNIITDIQKLHAANRISTPERDRLIAEANRVRGTHAMEYELMESNIVNRWRIWANAVKRGEFSNARRFLPRALPRAIYRTLYHLREKWRGTN